MDSFFKGPMFEKNERLAVNFKRHGVGTVRLRAGGGRS